MRTQERNLMAVAPTTAPAQAGLAPRLVVVVPDVTEAALLAGRIHGVARARGAHVLLIGVAPDPATETELRRQLALLGAFVRNAGTDVEIRVERDLEWISGFRYLLSDHDMLACCTGNSPHESRQTWADVLSARLSRPVYVFEQADQAHVPGRNRLAGLLPWLGSIAILLGFLWLQIQLSQHGGSAADTTVLVLSVPIEVGLIWLCNSSLS